MCRHEKSQLSIRSQWAKLSTVTSGFMSCYRLQWQEEETTEEGFHCLATKLVIKSNKVIKKYLLFCFLHLCAFSVVNLVHRPSIKHGHNHNEVTHWRVKVSL